MTEPLSSGKATIISEAAMLRSRFLAADADYPAPWFTVRD
jgi:hypothetical protein